MEMNIIVGAQPLNAAAAIPALALGSCLGWI